MTNAERLAHRQDERNRNVAQIKANAERYARLHRDYVRDWMDAMGMMTDD